MKTLIALYAAGGVGTVVYWMYKTNPLAPASVLTGDPAQGLTVFATWPAWLYTRLKVKSAVKGALDLGLDKVSDYEPEQSPDEVAAAGGEVIN